MQPHPGVDLAKLTRQVEEAGADIAVVEQA